MSENNSNLTSCKTCQKDFKKENKSIKYCSDECRQKAREKTSIKSRQKRTKTFRCKFCKKEYQRVRERNGFCTRPCASKFYYKNNDNIKYILKTKRMKKSGTNKKCVICQKDFYAAPRNIEKKKICGNKSCKKEYMSKIMAVKSKGRKHTKETKDKIKKTIKERYNVENPFLLAKHTSLSKPQKEIHKFLKENIKNVKLDHPIYCGDKCYKVDILLNDKNYIIEFNGSYWHCDPRTYKEDYLNKKKNKTAKEIWREDKERYANLQNLGYKVNIIWELDYNKNKEEILKNILEDYEKT